MLNSILTQNIHYHNRHIPFMYSLHSYFNLIRQFAYLAGIEISQVG